jgi:hypothetical protein
MNFRKIYKFVLVILSCSLFLTICFFSQACFFFPSNKLNDDFSVGLVMGDRSYFVDSYGQPIVLVENNKATDPSYKELVNFLNSDITDQYPYISSVIDLDSSIIRSDPRRIVDKDLWLQIINGQASQSIPRICADFAETLHNNAEINGIRAGYVSITLSSSTLGHAINVFNTTDKGLVFIDDTGKELQTQNITPGFISFGITDSCDKAGYLEIGRPYGVISLEVADLYGFDYSAYDKWLADKVEFDDLSDQYENIQAGRTSIPRSEYYRLQDLMSRMDNLSEQLGGFWGGLDGVVTNYIITWNGQW